MGIQTTLGTWVCSQQELCIVALNWVNWCKFCGVFGDSGESVEYGESGKYGEAISPVGDYQRKLSL